MKRLLKNNNGNAIVFIILMIPTIIFLTLTLSYGKMFQAGHEKRLITIMNNTLYYANETYGNIGIDKNGNDYCSYTDKDIFGVELADGTPREMSSKGYIPNPKNECFMQDFYEVFSRIDGYCDSSIEGLGDKCKWYFTVKIETNEGHKIEKEKSEFNTYITVKVYAFIPNYKVDFYGRIKNGQTLDTSTDKAGHSINGWYQGHLESLKVMKESEFFKIKLSKTSSAV